MRPERDERESERVALVVRSFFRREFKSDKSAGLIISQVRLG